jgi:hypothetical protein
VRVTKASVVPTCAICERTLLMGERTVRFAPFGARHEFVEVCPLCQEIALEHGWVKEGSPIAPTPPAERQRRPGLTRRLASRRSQQRARAPIAAEPILRRLSDAEQALVEAADLFNASDHRRTVVANAKSLGEPRASIVRLRGVNNELVITIAWDISWYQYRVSPDSVQPVRLADRGQDASDLELIYCSWNARFGADGRLVPNIARL